MDYAAGFIPSPTTQPYAYLEHYIKIEDSKGNTLYTRTFDSRETLKRTFEEISVSKESYSFFSRTVFPVRYHRRSKFFRAFFLPNTLAVVSHLEHRVAKVAVGLFTGLFDIATSPIRMLTAAPYVIYDKFIRKEADHKIITLIKDNPDAARALDEGKVVVRCVTEDFSRIQVGTLQGQLNYRVKGTVTSSFSESHIKRPLYAMAINKSGEERFVSFSGNVNESMKSHYHAFSRKN